MTATRGQNPPPYSRPRLSEAAVLLAPVPVGLVASFLLPPLPPPSRFWEALVGQSAFALAPLAVALSGRPSWGSLGLRREGLARSLALGALYALPFVVQELIVVRSGSAPPFQIVAFEATRHLGVPLSVALFVPFWGIFESVWMCYLIHAANRWLTGGGVLRWRALLLAALLFGLLHVQSQLVFAGAALPQALGSVLVGLALLIPGTIPKLTGNAWGLVLWFTVTNF